MDTCLWKDVVSDVPRESGGDRGTLPPDVDVAIVGAGFTGLWTAHYLNLASPDTTILVIESNRVGHGASGRNGGWCSSILPMSLDQVAEMSSRDDAIRLQLLMYDTVDEVGRQAASFGIECGFRKGGYIGAIRDNRQMERAHDSMREAARWGLDGEHVQLLDADSARIRIGATRLHGALFHPDCAVIQPYRLVTGLAESLRRRGVVIAEDTVASDLEERTVRTSRGDVRAGRVVRATEAYSTRWKSERRRVIPLYSMMIATEPLDESIWSTIGLAERETFNDLRRMVIYGQRTDDGRIAFGGRGAPYHFGSRISTSFDRHEPTKAALTTALQEMFPALRDVAVTHHWGGPLAAARDWTMSVGSDEGILRGGAYVGDGVATSNLVGRILADLVLDRDTELMRLPIVGHRSPTWEPEPLRWIGINSLAALAKWSDTRRPGSTLAGRIVDSFVG
ncbi:MAG: FAD-dependent oxidoreductase [Acidimicrobiales bacterium mtb01]|nr:FAD-dependent oxidoreductase [Actinomycetota bacterium]TEX45275.1 MAG: FAD-dependent oxidoreductase [Acidimicrobiales bacterium mtb01]